MKTSIKTLIATGLIAVSISSSSVVFANNNSAETKKPETISANKISLTTIKRLVVTGDVEVTLSQSPKSNTLCTSDDSNFVTFRKIGNALYVDAKKGTHNSKVTIYVDDIYRIDASQDAVILSDNKLNLKYLQVYLKDNAYLDLNANTEQLYTVMQSSSRLNLKGHTNAHTITMDKASRVSLEKFTSKNTERLSDVYVGSRM